MSLVRPLLVLVALAACSKDPTPPPPAPPPTAPSATPTPQPPSAPEVIHDDVAQAGESPHVVRGRRDLMSTIYEVTVVAPESPDVHGAIDRALDEVERLGVVLSEWRPDSEVSHVNSAAGREAVRVGADTWANIAMAVEVARWTDGAFDPSWAALRGFYLFQPGQRSVPDLAAVRARLPLVNYRDVLLDETQRTVKLKQSGMALGLGGIAKGWAVDRASEILLRAGFPDHMVFAGGQVLVHGKKGERAWRVGIQHPRMNEYFGFVEATDASIATSGDYEHFFIADDGTRWHHIIDLKTGLPARASTSVTIVAPTGLLADGLDTGCFVMGPEPCLRMLAQRAPDVGAVIVDADLRIQTTPGMRAKLIMRMPLDQTGRLPSGHTAR